MSELGIEVAQQILGSEAKEFVPWCPEPADFDGLKGSETKGLALSTCQVNRLATLLQASHAFTSWVEQQDFQLGQE